MCFNRFNRACFFAFILMVLSLYGCGGSKEVTVIIKPIGNEMKYETTTFSVKAGQKVRLVMDNTATLFIMKHNVVILRSKEAIDEVGQQAISAKDNLPDHAAIIAATPITDPQQRSEVTFTAPETPGEYPYICTYPGHYISMRGVMIVN